ncbi:Bifunctional (p)ppGpp synthase/hydrolase relA [Bosea sp. LC85]|uniref:HD domain-containing protein n=1 Tax=Bosea sp. LC85 TaxID=1502851 RepID=UPI0004E30362|nr:HD domain-containing protein [Bosea sp. LC85]KFC63896.1 Bifunctional (p)ppGpp synthase/hydrolase relA [Bosea sp. LC85]
MGALARAIEIAAEAHEGQRDKAGEPYIAHPMRLMARFLAAGGEQDAIIAALHDVVERSEWTLEDLRREGFSDEVVFAIEALTRKDGEEYLAFIRRAASHPQARFVKQADLLDNMTHLSKVRDGARLSQKYASGLSTLHETPLPLSCASASDHLTARWPSPRS